VEAGSFTRTTDAVPRAVVEASAAVHHAFTAARASVHLCSLACLPFDLSCPASTSGPSISKGTELKLSTTTRAAVATVAVAGTLALSACGASNENSSASGASGGSSTSSAPKLSGTLNGAGSSAQQAAMQGWTAGFSGQQPGVTVNYDPIGSGGGRKQFLAPNGSDFAGSDAALTDAEVTQAGTRCGAGAYFELPDYVSAIAVVYNLPGVKNLQLSPATLAKVFAGQITTWNDPAIAADNPGVSLPSTKVSPVHRADDSGTTTNFTDYLNKAAGDVWTNAARGTWPLQGGEAANQTSGMVAAVKAGEGAIGYADESQAAGLGIAKIKVGSGYVAPSAKGAAALVGSSPTVSGRSADDLAIQLNRTTTDADEYPIVLVSYHIGCLQPTDATKGQLLKAFMSYVISSDGQRAAAEAAGSAPISDAQRTKSQTVVDAIKG
jgi:phosphate transport system substrate-binding protein